ncbi:hypothetical protein D0863_06001 [Hortaea werneckii]|uniref:Fungal N-terminal domain-containing protein n=1 Tax=Hortaea werneckii TaxID=91943 RepID=A0A3M7E163_HORWE|nr:hypothetical protein D0863_06001 [Hortaea werneckii]
MDPLSITASCIAILGASTATGKALHKLIALRKAPEDLQQLFNEREASQINSNGLPDVNKLQWMKAGHKIRDIKQKIRDARNGLKSAFDTLNLQQSVDAYQTALQIQTVVFQNQEDSQNRHAILIEEFTTQRTEAGGANDRLQRSIADLSTTGRERAQIDTRRHEELLLLLRDLQLGQHGGPTRVSAYDAAPLSDSFALYDFNQGEASHSMPPSRLLSLRHWAPDKFGFNALHNAALYGGTQLMKILVGADLRGLDPLQQVQRGLTPDNFFYRSRDFHCAAVRAPFEEEEAAWRTLMDSARRQNGLLIDCEDDESLNHPCHSNRNNKDQAFYWNVGNWGTSLDESGDESQDEETFQDAVQEL